MPTANAMGIAADMLDESMTSSSETSKVISFSMSVATVSSEAASTTTVQPPFHQHKTVHGHL